METCIALYCIAPGENSITSFADCKKAYDDLSDAIKSEIRELVCEHRVEDSKASHWLTEKEVAYFYQRDSAKKGLVRNHPISQEAGLYFPYSTICGIQNLNESSTKKLVEFLHGHVTQEKYIYHHHWKKGDLILNDQVHSIHRRNAVSGDRLLYRLAFNYEMIRNGDEFSV